ncbi:helix-turn-helix domain-containing protein [Streptomyces sp. NPDC004658]|uniref:helix-turn-helix domain-containing protein n=1 Tax=Streptomyces sp. NPDC004658 TaxID=3154672 RepID=UPI0033A79005
MANGNPAHNPHQDDRDGKGQYIRTINNARRDAHAAELRAEGWTYQQIADELGIDKSNAILAVRRAVRDACAGPGQDLINLEVHRLEAMYDQVIDILSKDRPVVSHGHIVYGDDGQPLVDDELKLKAIDRALRTRESFRKLLGLDAPSRVSIEAEQLGREISRLLDAATTPEDAGDDTDA